VHPLILFVDQPAFLALLNTFTAPWRARFAALSVYSLIAIVVMGVNEASTKGPLPGYRREGLLQPETI
jgi:hypothetical protein